jgi:hypothetical protein
MLDKLAADSSSSACQPVAAALRLQAAVHSAITVTAQLERCCAQGIAATAAAPALLQQLQRALALLPDTPAPAVGSSSSSSSAGSVAAVVNAVVPLQQSLLQLQYQLWSDGAVDVGVLDALLASDSSAAAAMQLLCAYTYLMYDQHTAAAAAAAGTQQRRQQRQDGDTTHGMRPRGDSSADAVVSGSSRSSSSSSSTSSSACSASFKRPVQLRLLPISPVHERLQLLPAASRQLYLQAVQRAPANSSMDGLLTCVQAAVHALSRHTSHAHTAQEQQQQQQLEEQNSLANSTPAAAPAPPGVAAAGANAPELAASCGLTTCPALTEQAVLLVIEVLQLLAAMCEQADDQQLQFDSLCAYGRAALLLRRQLSVLQRCPALRKRHSSLLQQYAQQLMQLLRWQLQQAAQHSTLPIDADASAWESLVDGIVNLAKATLFEQLVDHHSGLCLLNVQPKELPPRFAYSNARFVVIESKLSCRAAHLTSCASSTPRVMLLQCCCSCSMAACYTTEPCWPCPEVMPTVERAFLKHTLSFHP